MITSIEFPSASFNRHNWYLSYSELAIDEDGNEFECKCGHGFKTEAEAYAFIERNNIDDYDLEPVMDY